MDARIELLEALESQPEPPCTGCANFVLCGAQQMSCSAFGAYTRSDPYYNRRSKEPSREFYEVHFWGQDDA